MPKPSFCPQCQHETPQQPLRGGRWVQYRRRGYLARWQTQGWVCLVCDFVQVMPG
jgi:hypothetical protein